MKRRLDITIENNLLKNSMWINKLKADCINQKVFFAIRENRIDLYHKGGRLFCFEKNEFKTHIKYASVITNDLLDDKDYLTESQLTNYQLAIDFETNYGRIKENCANYSGVEAKWICRLN